MKKRLLIIFGVTATIVLIATLAFLAVTFRVTSVSPKPSNLSVITPFIDVEFNKALADDPQVKGDVVSKVVASPKRLRLYLKDLEFDQKYTIDIQVKSTTGKTLNKQINFTARNIRYEDLPKKQREAIIEDQDSFSPSKNDPILNVLPYGSTEFSLTAVVGDNPKPEINAKILLSKSDVTSGQKDAIIASIKTRVGQYIASQGLNPASYVINYEIVEPSIY